MKKINKFIYPITMMHMAIVLFIILGTIAMSSRAIPLNNEIPIQKSDDYRVGEIKYPPSTQQAELRLQNALIQATHRDGQSNRAIAIANAQLAQFYADQNRYNEAIQLLWQAIFYALRYPISHPDLLFRYEWQLGRLFKLQGQFAAATTAYQRAIKYLRDIRYDLANIAKTLPVGTAIFFPIILEDRIELLLGVREVSAMGHIQQLTLPNIGKALLTQEAIQFRAKLEIASHLNGLLQHAQQIYQWIIAPIAKILVAYNIDTLVIVPDGILHSIPFAALHDGKQFLIQRYAIAVSPSIKNFKLVDTSYKMPRDNIQILLNGLTKQNPDKIIYPTYRDTPLPHVTQELSDIQAILGGDILKDENFVFAKLIKKLKSKHYTIIHFATHGVSQYDPNKPHSDEAFLLTYKDKINISRLRKIINLSLRNGKPLELLTLSACNTARGDVISSRYVTLGLASVAVEAGVRSVLASLWAVNDMATARLVTAFYRHLKNPSLSKAQALQKAQQELLHRDGNHRDGEIQYHPYFWAALLLVGNWQ